MTFKARHTSPPSKPTTPASGRHDPSNVSILIVDDSATMRSVIRAMLTRLGFKNLDEAEDGRAALSLVNARGYTVIISDWHMEPMNGIELLHEVRRISRPGMNKFIFATSEGTWGGQTTAKSGGAEAYLVKPFTIESLQSKLSAVLGTR